MTNLRRRTSSCFQFSPQNKNHLTFSRSPFSPSWRSWSGWKAQKFLLSFEGRSWLAVRLPKIPEERKTFKDLKTLSSALFVSNRSALPWGKQSVCFLLLLVVVAVVQGSFITGHKCWVAKTLICTMSFENRKSCVVFHTDNPNCWWI